VYPADISLARMRLLIGGEFVFDALDSGMRESLDCAALDLCADLTFTAIGRMILEQHPTDVVAIYLRGADAVCHKFWEDREWMAKGMAIRNACAF
jgi:hypothetical protein